MNKIAVFGLLIISIAVLGIIGTASTWPGFSAGSVTGSATKSGATFEIPLSHVTENAKFYEYDSGGTTVRFFAVRASDGSIKTAFDACDSCYSSRKGYRQEGNYMLCNNCGNRYPITGLGTENKNPGGCWPGYLPSNILGDKVIIQKSDIESGNWRFH